MGGFGIDWYITPSLNVLLVPRPFPFPRHGKGPRNEVEIACCLAVLPLRSFTFFCLLSNAFPGIGSVGWSVGKEKNAKKKKKNGEVSN